jgi:hypothetical protein
MALPNGRGSLLGTLGGRRPRVLSSTLFINLICGFSLCTQAHITGMLLTKNSAPTLPETTYPRFFPPCNFKHDRTKGNFRFR